MPEIALLGMQGLNLEAIGLSGRNLRLEIGLLRLKAREVTVRFKLLASPHTRSFQS
jgi:hypothetical protein